MVPLVLLAVGPGEAGDSVRNNVALPAITSNARGLS
jgi:hypothetical protein